MKTKKFGLSIPWGARCKELTADSQSENCVNRFVFTVSIVGTGLLLLFKQIGKSMLISL
jgi:hypothetical protein